MPPLSAKVATSKWLVTGLVVAVRDELVDEVEPLLGVELQPPKIRPIVNKPIAPTDTAFRFVRVRPTMIDRRGLTAGILMLGNNEVLQ